MSQAYFRMEEDLPLLNDQEDYDLMKDILSDEVHVFDNVMGKKTTAVRRTGVNLPH